MEIDQIILAKYIFKKGENILAEKNPFSCGLAISLFQDSVEILARAIAKSLKSNFKANPNFLDYWEIVQSAPLNNKKELPLKGIMEDLNKARISFKHNGIIPDPQMGKKFLTNTEEFLIESTERFFSQNFHDISMADLIKDYNVKEKIKTAEKYYIEGNYLECLRECAESEVLIKSKFKFDTIHLPFNFSGISEFISNDRYRTSTVDFFFRDLAKTINLLGTYCMLSLLNMGSEYFKFHDIVPYASMTVGGTFQVSYQHDNYSQYEAKFCIDFIIEFALKVQEENRKMEH